jgi:hypothetical protein
MADALCNALEQCFMCLAGIGGGCGALLGGCALLAPVAACCGCSVLGAGIYILRSEDRSARTLFSQFAKKGGSREWDRWRKLAMTKETHEEKYKNPVHGSDREKLAELENLSAQNEVVLEQYFAVFLEKFGHCVQFKHNRKTRSCIIEKSVRPDILESKPWYKIEHIRDTFRFKAVVMGFDEAFLVLQSILIYELIPGATPIKLDIQKCLSPKQFGWRFMGLDLQMANGQLVELYIPFFEMDETKKRIGHAIFGEWCMSYGDAVCVIVCGVISSWAAPLLL